VNDRVHAEAELLFQIAEGNKAALSTLYRTFGARLFGVAIRMLRSQSEAENLLHDF